MKSAMELFCRNCSGDPFSCRVDEAKQVLILRVEFEKGGFGNPTRKEGKAFEVDGESEKNEDDDDDDGEGIVEIEVNTIFVLFYDIVGF